VVPQRIQKPWILKVDAMVQTGRLDALALVLQSPGFLNVGQRLSLIRNVMFVGISNQDAELVADHVKLYLHVGAILLREQGGQLGLDLGLLVKQVLDGRVQRGVMRRRE